MPEELAEQMLPLKQVLDAMSVPCYELSGYEADDLIGTISRKCEAAGWDCTIATGDRDSLQLITAHTHVRLLTGGKGPDGDRCMTESTFRAEYGFDPIHMIDLKALAGDSSDNIPGVPGIGEKTAMALVQQYGSIDAVYANIDSVPLKPVFLCKLKEGEASARHSYWLATIDTNAPLDFDPEDNLRQPFKPELYDLFLKLEFQKLIDKYQLSPACVAEELPTYTAEAEILETAERAEACLALWREAAYVTVYGTPDLAALAVECETGADSSLMVEIYVNRYAGDWRALLSALFAPDIRKVGHNVKDMMRALLAQGLPADGFIFDTALELACFSRPWSRQMLAEELDNQCAAFLVALEPETEKVIGYAGLLVAADEGYITNVAVDPSRRRQGVAAQLLQVFDNFARGNQLAFLTLEVRPSNTAAIALYQGFGFREVGRRRNYYDLPKEDALILTKYYTEEAAQ